MTLRPKNSGSMKYGESGIHRDKPAALGVRPVRTLGIQLLRVPNDLVLEEPEGFVRKVWEQMGAVRTGAG